MLIRSEDGDQHRTDSQSLSQELETALLRLNGSLSIQNHLQQIDSDESLEGGHLSPRNKPSQLNDWFSLSAITRTTNFIATCCRPGGRSSPTMGRWREGCKCDNSSKCESSANQEAIDGRGVKASAAPIARPGQFIIAVIESPTPAPLVRDCVAGGPMPTSCCSS